MAIDHKPSKKPVVYRLRVSLSGVSSEIWREILVPANANMGWLHAVIQVAMGWTNSHLHQFPFGRETITDPDFELDDVEGSPRVLDENIMTLREVAPRNDIVIGYEYDFGDSWHHNILVQAILDPDAAVTTKARCIAGARACPPDDCGGVGGYADFLEAMSNRKHPEHKAMKEWLGRPFDSEAFDIKNINQHLHKLPWPRVSPQALARVLISRDGDQAQ